MSLWLATSSTILQSSFFLCLLRLPWCWFSLFVLVIMPHMVVFLSASLLNHDWTGPQQAELFVAFNQSKQWRQSGLQLDVSGFSERFCMKHFFVVIKFYVFSIVWFLSIRRIVYFITKTENEAVCYEIEFNVWRTVYHTLRYILTYYNVCTVCNIIY